MSKVFIVLSLAIILASCAQIKTSTDQNLEQTSRFPSQQDKAPTFFKMTKDEVVETFHKQNKHIITFMVAS
jgi:PBP1b-binding outer membrane lipoprotein LpoB